VTDKRGIVISTPLIATKEIFQIDAEPLDPHELRYWLLFWDKLNFPLFEGFHIDPGDDGQFLESVGILQRHQISANLTISSDDKPEESFQYHFLSAYRELDAAEPGVWSLATGERSITLDEEELDSHRGVLVRLHRALPVPEEDVPLEDVLSFKEKRRDELLALRCQLEAMYQRIRAAPDGPLAINSELTAADKALSDYLKVAKGSWIRKWVPTSIDAELQILPGINSAVTAFAAGLPLFQALATGASTYLSISAGKSLRDQQRHNGVPWRYVARYHNELFHWR
jgi:hypothetical protein